MSDIAIIGFAQTRNLAAFPGNEIELLLPVVQEAVRASGLSRERIQFTTLASSDAFAGQAFAFVRALDAAGAYPVLDDSHVDMDGAFALYEAWLRLLTGDVDSALVYALGKSSSGRMHEIGPLGLDPYCLAPLGLDPVSTMALSARATIERGLCSEADLSALSRVRLDLARRNPLGLARDLPFDERPLASPLRAGDVAPTCDGAAAVVLARADLARDVCAHPIWIRGMDQRVDAHGLGLRPLHDAPSARLAAHQVGAFASAIDLAELMCLGPHEEFILRRALDLTNRTRINESGSGWSGHPVMATGLIRVVEAARALREGRGRRALAHASAGPCLQQNFVTILESDHG